MRTLLLSLGVLGLTSCAALDPRFLQYAANEASQGQDSASKTAPKVNPAHNFKWNVDRSNKAQMKAYLADYKACTIFAVDAYIINQEVDQAAIGMLCMEGKGYTKNWIASK